MAKPSKEDRKKATKAANSTSGKKVAADPYRGRGYLPNPQKELDMSTDGGKMKKPPAKIVLEGKGARRNKGVGKFDYNNNKINDKIDSREYKKASTPAKKSNPLKKKG